MKKKILLFLISLTCSLSFAQKNIDLGQDDDNLYKIKPDSFIVYKNNFVGITVDTINIDSKQITTTKYKVAYNSCSNKDENIKLIELSDSGTKTVDTHLINKNTGGIYSLTAIVICNHVERIVQGIEFIK